MAKSQFSIVTALFSIALVLFFAIFLLLTWKTQTKSNYIDYLKDRQTESLKSELSVLNEKLSKYESDIEFLSSRVHSDNKLIPATIDAVRNFINSDNPNQSQKDILDFLNKILSERTSNLPNFDSNTSHLHSGDMNIDSIINYMVKVGASKNVVVDVCGLNALSNIEMPISSEAMASVIADLLENSIHSCKNVLKKKVLIDFSYTDNHFSIYVYDTGEDFSLNVFNHMGISRYTTRKKDGGTGIGLMNIFDNIRESGASFCLIEHPKNSEFSKIINISFDGLFEHTIYSNRKSQIRRKMIRFDFQLYTLEQYAN